MCIHTKDSSSNGSEWVLMAFKRDKSIGGHNSQETIPGVQVRYDEDVNMDNGNKVEKKWIHILLVKSRLGDWMLWGQLGDAES